MIELIDPRWASDFNKVKAMTMINVALICINMSPKIRLVMSSVVSMFEDEMKIEAPPLHATATIDEEKVTTLREHFRGTSSEKLSKNVIQRISMEDPHTASSILSNDLYPVNLDSGYLLCRD